MRAKGKKESAPLGSGRKSPFRLPRGTERKTTGADQHEAGAPVPRRPQGLPGKQGASMGFAACFLSSLIDHVELMED